MDLGSGGGVTVQLQHLFLNPAADVQWDDAIRKFRSWVQLEEVAPCFTIEMENLANGMIHQMEQKVAEFLNTFLKKMKWSLAPVSTRSASSLKHVMREFDKNLRKMQDLQGLIEKALQLIGCDDQFLEPHGNIHRDNSSLQDVLEKLKNLEIILMSHVMIPEVQPPALVKALTKFPVSVRFLSMPTLTTGSGQQQPPSPPVRGKKRKDDEMKLPAVKFEILSKQEMRSLYFAASSSGGDDSPQPHQHQQSTLLTPPPSGNFDRLDQDVTGNIGKMDPAEPMVVQFKEASISKVDRRGGRKISQKTADGRSNGSSSPLRKMGMMEAANADEHEDTAMKEKFFLKYSTRLNIQGVTYEIWCCSTPFVFYTNNRQLPEAKGTVFWDTTFVDSKSEIPFRVLDKIPWSIMSAALDTYFKKEIGPTLTRDLTMLNLVSLRKTFLSNSAAAVMDHLHGHPNDVMMERQPFFEKTSPDFSHWLWFHGIIKLFQGCQEIQEIWNAGLMIGFIDTPLAERVLATQEPGTFLIRLSWSQIGGIALSFLGREKTVWHAGFSEADLKVISLRDRIRNETRLLRVYCVDHMNREYVMSKFDAFPVLAVGQSAYAQAQVPAARRGYVTPVLLQLLQVPE